MCQNQPQSLQKGQSPLNMIRKTSLIKEVDGSNMFSGKYQDQQVQVNFNDNGFKKECGNDHGQSKQDQMFLRKFGDLVDTAMEHRYPQFMKFAKDFEKN